MTHRFTPEQVEALLTLADRVEAAMGPNYALDCAIWDAVYPGERDERFRKLTCDGPYKGRLGPADKDGYIKPLRAFTTSLDAAMTLVPEGWYWRVGHGVLWVGWAHLNRKHPDHCDRDDEHSAHAETPALALCAAALRARASLHQAPGTQPDSGAGPSPAAKGGSAPCRCSRDRSAQEDSSHG